MSYHLRLCKSLSYKGIVSATKKQPDVFVEDKATAEAAVATGYFVLVEDEQEQAAQPEAAAHPDKEQLESMKFDDLKKLAEDMGIDTKGLEKKTELVEAISAVEVIPGEEENEVDYGEDEQEQAAQPEQEV